MEKRIFRTTGQIVTVTELATTFTTAQLLEEFNHSTIALGGNPITKFSNRANAERRTWACMKPAPAEPTWEDTQKALAEITAPRPISEDIKADFTAIQGDMDGIEEPEVKVPTPLAGTPVTPPATSPSDPMVFCGVCGRSVPKSTTFALPSTTGDKHYCKKDPACKKQKGKNIDLKEQAKVASAKATAAKAPKTKKEPKGPNPNIGRFDNCLLSAKENKRSNSESVRSGVYNHIATNQGCTIKDMERDGVALLPVLRDCVKKLFADGKIEVSGWEVVTPRTLNFREVK